MWVFMIPIILLLNDYLKNPIDRLYFQKPLRPLIGIRNSLVDLFFISHTIRSTIFQAFGVFKNTFSI